uniref:RING-type domain-containing protein n=1 Tax=Noctiluca scintillans TaxID=2966 RepID=A0A7S1A579_NOCSC
MEHDRVRRSFACGRWCQNWSTRVRWRRRAALAEQDRLRRSVKAVADELCHQRFPDGINVVFHSAIQSDGFATDLEKCLKVEDSAAHSPLSLQLHCEGSLASSSGAPPAGPERRVGNEGDEITTEILTYVDCPICFESNLSCELCVCGHNICIRCAVSYIRSALSNAREEIRPEGIRCPLSSVERCTGMIAPEKGRVLLHVSQLMTPATDSFLGPLTADEADRLERFTVEASLPFDTRIYCPKCEQLSLLSSVVGEIGECPYCGHCWNHSDATGRDAATALVIASSSKPCPNCQLAITHYHGHGCHHISPGMGCPRCLQHFCYVCLKKHGAPGVRKWNPTCKHRMSVCKQDQILDHVVLRPLPHDGRCTCPLCPDCRPGAACPQCFGNCVVCQGVVPPANRDGSWHALECLLDVRRKHGPRHPLTHSEG